MSPICCLKAITSWTTYPQYKTNILFFSKCIYWHSNRTHYSLFRRCCRLHPHVRRGIERYSEVRLLIWFGNVGCRDTASRSPMRTIQMGIFKYVYAFKDCPSSGTTSWWHATMKYTAGVGCRVGIWQPQWDCFQTHLHTIWRPPSLYMHYVHQKKKKNNNKSPLLLLCCHAHLQFYMEAFTITQSGYASCLLRIQEVCPSFSLLNINKMLWRVDGDNLSGLREKLQNNSDLHQQLINPPLFIGFNRSAAVPSLVPDQQ